MTRPTFAAGEAELADVYSRRKAVAELRAKANIKARETEEDGEAAVEKQYVRKPKKK